jgi:N-acetylneuraminate synthase
MEFTPEQWAGLKRHADERQLRFISSAFSIEAVEFLSRLGTVAWKVASGEVGNAPLFEAMARTRLPFLISTGMSSWAEIDGAVALVRARGCPATVLQCTSLYPTPPEKVGLNVIPLLRERYGAEVGVGLSDHSGTIFPGLAAAAMGIDVLEVHVTLSREMFGPDVCASVTTGELKQLVDGVRAIETMRTNPVDKDDMARQLQPTRALFTKSIVAQADLPQGLVLTEQHLALKKPGQGMPPERLPAVIGRRTRRAIGKDQMLSEADLE